MMKLRIKPHRVKPHIRRVKLKSGGTKTVPIRAAWNKGGRKKR